MTIKDLKFRYIIPTFDKCEEVCPDLGAPGFLFDERQCIVTKLFGFADFMPAEAMCYIGAMGQPDYIEKMLSVAKKYERFMPEGDISPGEKFVAAMCADFRNCGEDSDMFFEDYFANPAIDHTSASLRKFFGYPY